MEIDQLNQTLEDFSASLLIHKEMVQNLLGPMNDKTLWDLYKEIERLNEVNSELRLDNGDMKARCLLLEQINYEISSKEDEMRSDYDCWIDEL